MKRLVARAGTSFGTNEVDFLAELVATARTSGNVAHLVQRPEFRAFESKVATMVRRQAVLETQRAATASQRADYLAALERDVVRLANEQSAKTRLELAMSIAKQLNADVRDVRRILVRRCPTMQPLRLTAAGQAVLDEYEQVCGRGTRNAPRYTVDKLAMKHHVPIEAALNMCWNARKRWKREAKDMMEAAE